MEAHQTSDASTEMDDETEELVNSILDNFRPPVALQFRQNHGWWDNESIVHMPPRVLPDGKNY